MQGTSAISNGNDAVPSKSDNSFMRKYMNAFGSPAEAFGARSSLDDELAFVQQLAAKSAGASPGKPRQGGSGIGTPSFARSSSPVPGAERLGYTTKRRDSNETTVVEQRLFAFKNAINKTTGGRVGSSATSACPPSPQC